MDSASSILVLVIMTSVGAYVAGAKTLGLSQRRLQEAAGKLVESVGITCIFWGLNVLFWSFFVVTIRFATRHSPSFYVVSDPSLLVLSVLQGLFFVWWMESSSKDVSSGLSGNTRRLTEINGDLESR